MSKHTEILTYVTTHRHFKSKCLQNTLSFKLELAQMSPKHTEFKEHDKDSSNVSKAH